MLQTEIPIRQLVRWVGMSLFKFIVRVDVIIRCAGEKPFKLLDIFHEFLLNAYIAFFPLPTLSERLQ